MIEVTEDTFQQEVLDSETPVLVDFWAEWCLPCHMVAPEVEAIAEERDDLKVVKLNVDDSPDVMRQYNVMSIPSLVLFKGGEAISRAVGARSKSAILEIILPALP